jgi:hypothetical protein
MQELINKLTATTGISEEQAAQAITVVADFIKEKLPPMMHGVVDNFVGKKEAGESGGIADMMSGFMGAASDEHP